MPDDFDPEEYKRETNEELEEYGLKVVDINSTEKSDAKTIKDLKLETKILFGVIIACAVIVAGTFYYGGTNGWYSTNSTMTCEPQTCNPPACVCPAPPSCVCNLECGNLTIPTNFNINLNSTNHS